MPLPEDVAEVCRRFLTLADARVPGLVEGLHLHGSLALGEYVPGRSDIDFVAVMSHRPDPDELDGLRDVHRLVHSGNDQPHFDGMHVIADDLVSPPEECPDVPCVLAGEFMPAARCDVNQVTWYELARHRLSLRGELPESVWTDEDVLVDYTRANVRSYWQPQSDQLAHFPAGASDPHIATWFVLGIPRLHHVLTRRSLTSKSAAGHYALETFEERWEPLVVDAMTFREQGRPSLTYDHDPMQRGREVIAFSRMAVESALHL